MGDSQPRAPAGAASTAPSPWTLTEPCTTHPEGGAAPLLSDLPHPEGGPWRSGKPLREGCRPDRWWCALRIPPHRAGGVRRHPSRRASAWIAKSFSTSVSAASPASMSYARLKRSSTDFSAFSAIASCISLWYHAGETPPPAPATSRHGSSGLPGVEILRVFH